MKTYLKNVAVLNMLKATPENVGQIYKIGNAAIAFVSPLTKPLLAKMDVKNIASVVEVPENTRLLKANGEYTLSGIGADSPFFLTVNGKLTVDERMTAEEIRASVAGGMINGIVYATASQMLALSGAGISVNGSCVTYPDGTGLRRDQSPLTAAEAGALTHSLFLPACVRIEEGVCSVLREKGLALYGNKGAIIDASQAADFYSVWQGSGTVQQIPEGFTMMRSVPSIGKQNAPLLRGKRYYTGDLYLRKDFPAAALDALDGLIVTGKLFLPERLLIPILDKLECEPELIPYDGLLICINGVHDLTLDAHDGNERLAYCVDGVLHVDPNIPPAQLRERISMIYINGLIDMTQAQQAALLPVLVGNYQLSDGKKAADEEEEIPEDVHVIGNVAEFVL